MKTILLCVTLMCPLFAAKCCLANEETVTLMLRTDKLSYRVGDTVHFKLDYKNVSNTHIWLLTEIEIHLVDIFVVQDMQSRRKAERILLPGETDIAWDAVASQVVQLKPRERTSRVIKAKIETTLPSFFEHPGTGLFLVLPASALQLSVTGEYLIRARFHSPLNHPVDSFLPKHVKLWHGDVFSNAVVIVIKGR